MRSDSLYMRTASRARAERENNGGWLRSLTISAPARTCSAIGGRWKVQFIFPGGRLRDLEVALVEEFSSLDIVSEVHLARDARKVPGTTHKLVFAVSVELGTIRCVFGGERIRRAECTARRSVGQTANEGFRAALLVGSARCGMYDLHRVGVPTADEAPCHFDRGIDARASGHSAVLTNTPTPEICVLPAALAAPQLPARPPRTTSGRAEH